MTPTEKQKTIAEQAIYGDLVITEHGQLTEMEERYGVGLEPLPVLRPLKDLTKEITHKGYYNDQPFIPLVELAKIIKPNFKSYELNVNNQEVLCLIEGHSRRYELYLFDSKEILLEESDLLCQWHFDSRKLLNSSKAISTDEVNPYEVK